MIELIDGGSHTDARGTFFFVNDFDMTPVKRLYYIRHADTSVIRAWQGHRHENKYFLCLRGSFLVCGVKIDNFENPSRELKAEPFILRASEPTILHIPSGYANGMKALQEDSLLQVFSDKTMAQAANDLVRFDPQLWLDWKKY